MQIIAYILIIKELINRNFINKFFKMMKQKNRLRKKDTDDDRKNCLYFYDGNLF